MSVERSNPLPPGVYWVDVFASKGPQFNAWLRTHLDSVRVKKTTHTAARGGYESRDWVLFEVLSPTPWEGPGFPTIAEQGIETKPEDTVQRPPPEPDPLDSLRAPAWGSLGLGIGLALGIGYLLSRSRR